MNWLTWTAAAPIAVLLVAGCGQQATPVPGASTPAPTDSSAPSVSSDQPELTATATVLEEGNRQRRHGPQLCLGGVLTSLPPQCDGPVITNWDWSAVEGEQRRGDTRWGEFSVVGHYDADADAFTLTRPAGPPADTEESDTDTVWRTPCREPDGGWRVLDPDRTNDASLDRALRTARQRSDYAGAWVDQSINPASDLPADEAEWKMNDPSLLILNIAVTGDTEAAGNELRQVWGGALCVSTAVHAERELGRIARELNDTPGLLGSEYGDDHVSITVTYDDAGALQAKVDSIYGPGVVRVSSALRPANNAERPTAQN